MKINKVDVYLIISILLMLTYTVVDKLQLIKTGLTNDQLTICFFAAFGTELFYTCVIKSINTITTNKKQAMEEELSNNKGDDEDDSK